MIDQGPTSHAVSKRDYIAGLTEPTDMPVPPIPIYWTATRIAFSYNEVIFDRCVAT
jgi:hypothetical protein